MPEVHILVCSTQQRAVTARQVLITAGIAAAGITIERTTALEYDAESYDGGGGYEALDNVWVVIGRQ